MLSCQRGDQLQAATLLQQALVVSPMSFNARFNLGAILHRSGNLIEARMQLEKALVIKPANPGAQIALALILIEQAEYTKAKKLLYKASLCMPQSPDVYMHLALLSETVGEPQEAENFYRMALAINPVYGMAHHSLALLKRFDSTQDADVISMLSALNDVNVVSVDSVLIAYALGKVFNDLGDYRRAFDFYRQANQGQSKGQYYDRAAQKDFFERHKLAQTPITLKHLKGEAALGIAPIFVVGMPRSGTSLVEQILASHPQVSGAGEVEYSRLLVDTCVAESAQPFPLGIESVSSELIAAAAKAYINRLQTHAGSAQYVVDKLPHNFLRLGLLASIFPRAAIIVCEREPLDVCLSIYQQHFSASHGYACDLEELGYYYNHYRNLMAHWEAHWPGRIHKVRYESLITDSDFEMRRLLSYCDLPFDKRCQEFHLTQRLVTTPSATQVRKPLYKTSLERWRNYEEELGPLREALAAKD